MLLPVYNYYNHNHHHYYNHNHHHYYNHHYAKRRRANMLV
jgi:hypothetical protein